MAAVLKNLIPAMSFYYPIFASKFGHNEEHVGLAMREYAERLDMHEVTGRQFMLGIEMLKGDAANSDYFPNPERFALMCKRAGIEALNIPSFDTVLSEIILRKGAERHNQQWQFSHPISLVICNRKGALIFELTGIEFEKAIKSEYEHWVKRIEAGEQLPEPQLVIGHDQRPEMPVELRVVPKSAMALRVEAMRAEALARKAH